MGGQQVGRLLRECLDTNLFLGPSLELSLGIHVSRCRRKVRIQSQTHTTDTDADANCDATICALLFI